MRPTFTITLKRTCCSSFVWQECLLVTALNQGLIQSNQHLQMPRNQAMGVFALIGHTMPKELMSNIINNSNECLPHLLAHLVSWHLLCQCEIVHLCCWDGFCLQPFPCLSPNPSTSVESVAKITDVGDFS